MTTCVITFWRVDVTSLTMSVSTMLFIEIMIILKSIKSYFKGSYDKQNFTLVVISYEIYETPRRLVSTMCFFLKQNFTLVVISYEIYETRQRLVS